MKTCFSVLARTIVGLALTALQGYAQSTYQPYTFTTIAGKSGSVGSADGTNSTARFNSAVGVALDSTGNLFVTDAGNNTIRKVTPVGTNWVVTTLAGQAGVSGSADGTNSAARFLSPYGVAVDSGGNVYVADSHNNTIRKVTPVGTNWVVTTLVGQAGSSGSADGTNNAARFDDPTGLAMDSGGNLYVTDLHNDMIRKVTPVGTNWVVTTIAGKAGSSGSADGTNSAARFSSPFGVAVDANGNLYVADQDYNIIRKVTPVGTNWVVTTPAGRAEMSTGSADGTGRNARFNDPDGVAVDTAGNIYVADANNCTIRKVTPGGTNWVVTTLAGKAGVASGADGTGSNARFAGPAGLAVDSAGNIYVGDWGNSTVRKGYPALMMTSAGPSFGFNGGQFGFDLTGQAGKVVVVEGSTDLVSWLPLWTNTLAGPLNFSDPQSGVHSERFYRALTK